MKLIVISNPTNLNNEHSLLCSLFESGLEYFHLRKPDLTYAELEAYIQLIPQQYKSKVILHSRHQLAVQYGLKGIHFTQVNPYKEQDGSPKEMHRSASFHSLQEIENANPIFQYVFISPVFDSISKAGYKTQINKNDLKSFLLPKSNKPAIIALGGINQQTLHDAIQIGFDGAAVLGSVWMADNPLEAFKNLLRITSSANVIKKNIHV